MPELPEVETVKRGLSRLIVGRVVADVWHDWPKSFPNAVADVKQFLIGSKVVGVQRRAKVLLIELDTKYSLVIHLKMTGQLVFISNKQTSASSGEQDFGAAASSGTRRTSGTLKRAAQPVSQKIATSRANQSTGSTDQLDDEERWGAGHPNDSLVGKLPDKSTHVKFTFKDSSELFFNDQRKFGWVRLLPTAAVSNIDFFKKLGPEPLSDEFTAKDFGNQLMRRKNSGIKAVLLDQTVIAGVGNIYADESLWGARIHPDSKVKNVSTSRLNTLFIQLKQILLLSIEKGGSTDKNYVDAEGKKGSYLAFANVFRRDGKPCPRCATTIVKMRSAGRGTHICPKCQRLAK